VAAIPCGGGNQTLSAAEAATLVGLQEWVNANRIYFKKTNISKYLSMVGMTTMVVGLIFPPSFLVAVVLLIIAFVVSHSRKIIPVEFPKPVITRHPWAFFRGTSHLISRASASQMQISLKDQCAKYRPHDPLSIPAADKSSTGIRDFTKLSLHSLAQLESEISSYHQHVLNQSQIYFVASIMTGNQAANLSTSIRQNLTQQQNALCATVSRVNQGISEQAATQQAFNDIEYITDNNRMVRTFFQSQSNIDLAPYLAWKNLLSDISSEYMEIVSLSAAEGWNRMIDASLKASNFLTNTVQHRLDEIEGRIEADAKEAIAALNAKKKDIQMDIDAKGRELEHQLDSQNRVVNAAKEAQTKLEKMHIPQTISFEIPVTSVSGGGGRISDGSGYISSVSTTITTKLVQIDNPAYKSGTQIKELANSMTRIEISKLDSLNQLKNENLRKLELYEKDIRKRMDLNKKEAEQRMKNEKEIALKHARAVEHLHDELTENPEKLDYNDFNRIMKAVWNRPANHLLKYINPIPINISSLVQEFQRIENDALSIEGMLVRSPVSQYSSNELEAHWIFGPDGQVTENVVANPLEIYVNNSVAVSSSNIAHLLAPMVAPAQVSAMSDDLLMMNIAHLQQNGWILPQLLKFTTNKTVKFFRARTEVKAPSQGIPIPPGLQNPNPHMIRAR